VTRYQVEIDGDARDYGASHGTNLRGKGGNRRGIGGFRCLDVVTMRVAVRSGRDGRSTGTR
jgi:hypothetical protein